MHKHARRTLSYLSILALFSIAVPFSPSRTTAEQADSQLFPETGKTVSGRFLQYWQQHGGLAQQGYPISDLLSEKSDVDGKTYSVQYFERAVFEMHTENQQPYDVLLSLLGSDRYAERYGPGGAPNQHTSTDKPLYFSETKHTVGGVFRTYWETHGGLADQGYPISDEFEEQAADGKTYTVQYFERAVFERHPENAGTPYEVLLSQLGSNRYKLLYQQRSFPPPVSPDFRQRDGHFSDHYFVWTETKLVPYTCTRDCWYPGRYFTVPVVTRALDLISSDTLTVTTVPTLEHYIALYGATAIGENQGKCLECVTLDLDIIAKDLTTGITTTLATAGGPEHRQAFARFSVGRYFIWQEIGDDGTRVLSWDSATRQTQVIFRDAVEPGVGYSLVAASERYLAFIVHGRLQVYDRRKDSTLQITGIGALGANQYCGTGFCNLQLSGDLLLWSDGVLHVTNLTTGKSQVVNEYGGNPVLLQGNRAIWTAQNSASPDQTLLAGAKLPDGGAVRLPDLQQPVAAGDWIVSEAGQGFVMTSVAKAFRDATDFPYVPPALPGKSKLVCKNCVGPVVGQGHQLFWIGPGGENSINMYDTATGKSSVVDATPTRKISLATDGRSLVWVEQMDNGYYRIQHLELDTGRLSTVVEATSQDESYGGISGGVAPGNINLLAVDGDTLYYISTLNARFGLWARTLSTGAERLINKYGASPVASHGRVLWREESVGSELRLTEMAGERHDTVLMPGQGTFPELYSLSADYAIWTDIDRVGGNVHLYDIARSEEVFQRHLSVEQGAIEGPPLLRGNTAVWTDVLSPTQSAIYSLDIPSKTLTQVALSPNGYFLIARAVLDDGSLAFTQFSRGPKDNKQGSTGLYVQGPSDLYVTSLP